jgi:tetratricopeptide (TPR) repeat protein
MTGNGRPGFQYSPLEFVDAVALRYSTAPPPVVLRELPAGVAEIAFEVLNLLWLFGSLGVHRKGAWFKSDELQALEEEILTSSALDPLFRSALGLIVGELARPNKNMALLPQACAAAAEWAIGANARETALAFIELSALAYPLSGRLALLAGRALKTHGKIREAEYWLRRSGKLAHIGRDWETLVLSQHSLGVLYWNQGGIARAERHLSRALRYAKKYKLRGEIGAINHELFVVRVTSDQLDGVEEFARAAFRHYLPDHPRLPHLAYDLAYYWLMRGYVHRVVPLFQELLPCFPEPAQRIQVLAALVRAAGASGDRDSFMEAWTVSQPLLSNPTIQATRAAALIDLGFGACHFELWPEASACFAEAVQTAEALGQHDLVIRAATCLERAENRNNPDTPPRPQTIAIGQNDAERLAHAFLCVLSEFSASADCGGRVAVR